MKDDNAIRISIKDDRTTETDSMDNIETSPLVSHQNRSRKYGLFGHRKNEKIRTIILDGEYHKYSKYLDYGRNTVNNQKYTLLSLLPKFFYEQFNQFNNLYFLVVAITQLPFLGFLFEELQVGIWWTFVAPLTFVIAITLLRELWDDIKRRSRDAQINNELYQKITLDNNNEPIIVNVKSKNIRVGDLIIVKEKRRVPCDLILIKCTNDNGSTYIRTDQLDGETDWKLRKVIPSLHEMYFDKNDKGLAYLKGKLVCLYYLFMLHAIIYY